METVRERMMKLFIENIGKFYTVNDIIAILSLDLKPFEVYRHIEHIAKSIKSKTNGKIIIVMQPPRCRKCGYIFRDLRKPRKPSKCPKCKSEWIEPPSFGAIIK
ncbi:MAG: transcriptional regulator [Thermoprotei archaeon]|nr:MAG: transcriptional regulator [Thermoprotei archaeon]